MKTPRLKGRALHAVLQIANLPGGDRVLREQMIREYGIDELLALPASARAFPERDPMPVMGAKPRHWHDEGLEPPQPGGRETAAALRASYRLGERSPTDVLETLYRRMDAGDFGRATHSPFVSADRERAHRQASSSTARWAKGEPLGPMDGIPVCIKDHHEMRGLPTTCGTAFMSKPASSDSWCVSSLEQAGAVIFAKSHTTEWGLQPTGYNPNFSMPRNPYDAARGAGGSSTGTAAGVALGYGPVGLGSDGGGSIRIPAALCGLVGIKPTFQRIGRTGDLWGGGTVSHNGPIGQTCADLVAFLSATSAPDSADVATTWGPDSATTAADWRRALGRGVRGCRIGVWQWAMREGDPAIVGACERALSALEAEGAELVPIDPPLARYHLAIGALLLAVESTGNLADIVAQHESATGDDAQVVLRITAGFRSDDFFSAMRSRATLRRRLAEALSDIDVIAMPTTNIVAPRYDLSEDRVAILDGAATRELCRFTFLANLTGLPAGTVPVGAVDGLPVGLQIVGDAWDEASVLAVLAHVERLGLYADLPPRA